MNTPHSTLHSLVSLLLLFSSLVSVASETKSLEEYMQTQAMTWERMPLQWNEGAFLGNGILGMMVYVDTLDNSLTLWLCRPDVTDHRKAPSKKTSLGVKDASVLTDFCRMDVGKMKLSPSAKITAGTMTLDIYRGCLTGTLHTVKGDIDFTAFTPYNSEVNVVKINSDIPYSWKLLPGSPRSPRLFVFPNLKDELQYEDNPAPLCENEPHDGWCVHTLTAGGDYATCWKERGGVMYLSTQNEVPATDVSLTKAKQKVDDAIDRGFQQLLAENVEWWNEYYKSGLINIPDKQLENFYHIQLYKLATCSNADGPAMDNFGTFYKTSQWPGLWWNLNVQLTYMSTLPTNRLEQAANFVRLMDESFLDVVENAASQKIGDFAWTLYIYYSYFKYKGSSGQEIAKGFMPKARAVLNKYKPHLQERDGTIHILATESPEYEGFRCYDNSNYNLANLRWLLQTMVEVCDLIGEKPADRAVWCDILGKLHPDAIDQNGYMIAGNQPLDRSHRHYSHLLSFYPLRLHNPNHAYVKQLLETSIDHWTEIEGGKALAGYSYTGATSLYAFLGNGEKAYSKIKHFLNEKIGISLLLPNTMYVESDGKNPVIETPLSAATATTEMLLQGWGGTIRLFPAIPHDWRDCSFNALRTEGGFVVSASRKDGQTQWVEITSEAGQECAIFLPEWKKPRVQKGECRVVSKGKGLYTIFIPKGETVLLTDNKTKTIDRSYTLPSEGNLYGVKDKNLPYLMDWPSQSISLERTHYKTSQNNDSLYLHIFRQHLADGKTPKRPAIVYFFGGGWNQGTPAQFYRECEYYANRGLVAISVEYRVKSVHGTTPFDSFDDAKDAMMWIRRHSEELNIDPDKIAVAGASAGGQLAAALATIGSNDDRVAEYMPNLLLLYYPVIDNSPAGYGPPEMKKRYREISPLHNIHKNMPPTMFLLGTKDHLIPTETASRFKEQMTKKKCVCQLHLFEGAGHPIFSYKQPDMKVFGEVKSLTDSFLGRYGYFAESKSQGQSQGQSRMMYADTSRKGLPFAKDPSVTHYKGQYFMYYSLPESSDGSKPWGIGIANSKDLTHWTKIGELTPSPDYQVEKKGICAPCAVVRADTLHLFYQTYNNGKADAICHAFSTDGINFQRDTTNPVFHPSAAHWTCGRAIDAEVAYFQGRYFMYYATRDKDFKKQILGVAATSANSSFAKGTWTEMCDSSILYPQLEWEGNCIEAPSVMERDGKLYMFYAGNYNNCPQQIGVAFSTDGIRWERLSDRPLLPNGKKGEWNSSESGHPAIFNDSPHTYLFYQGNNDSGKTWYLSKEEIEWQDGVPVIKK